MTEDKEYGLIITFTDQSPSFVNGFECGKLWQIMESREFEIQQTIHTENIDVIKMMCGHFGYAWEMKTFDDQYTLVKLTKGSNLKRVK